MNTKIVVLIGFMPNPRIINRIMTERCIGETHLICWDRGEQMLAPPIEDGYRVHTISIPAGNDPIKRLIPTKKFSSRALGIIKDIGPQIIHVQGLDMLQIAVNYKKKNRAVKIIYEVADLHRYIVDKQKGIPRKCLRKYLIYSDRALQKYYDLLILTSEAYYDYYFSSFVSKDKMLYIPNMQNMTLFDKYDKKKSGEFTVGYIGAVRYKKQIYNLIEAAKQCQIKLLIAGYEDTPIELEPICKEDPDIDWVGRFDYNKEVSVLYGKCDVMYSVYDADMANVRVALPNKLYESVYCEMPIIVAKGTYLADTVEKWSVGIAVDHKDVTQLVEAIKALQENDIYDGYVKNCKKYKRYLRTLNANELLIQKLNEMIAPQ